MSERQFQDAIRQIWCCLTSHDWDVSMIEGEPKTMQAFCSRCGAERGWTDYYSSGGKKFPKEELYD